MGKKQELERLLGQELTEDIKYDEKKRRDKEKYEAGLKAEAESGVVLVSESEEVLESGDRIPIPNRIAYEDSKMDLPRTALWTLSCLGQFTIQELEQFVKQYRNDLSYNEKIAINLLKKTEAGDKDAEKTFWAIQTKMLDKTNIQNQVNISVSKPDKVVTELLDNIANRIAAGSAPGIKSNP